MVNPEVPFSIFISVCKNSNLRSNLRAAESILHEAMHLKLIEEHIPLVKLYDGNLYFSPWRDEKRPAKGVLHRLFVFKALIQYFKQIVNMPEVQSERIYIEKRINQINLDLLSLSDFKFCPDLTTDGATLTANLLPSN